MSTFLQFLQASLGEPYLPPLEDLKKQFIKGICIVLIILGVFHQTSQHIGLVYNPTHSLPHRLFLNLKNLTPNKGDYTCIKSAWYGGNVIKKVVGVPGDRLAYDKSGNLWIGKALKIGKPKRKAKDGRLLTPLKPGIIPQGRVFVSGEHERSFDSRYEELGLIPEKDLQGRLLVLI
jgi:conjugal transfer pilin signal peptidase TrbI